MAEKTSERQRSEGRRLKAARILAGLTPEDLARAVGKHWKTVSRWERGVSAVLPLERQAIAAALRLDVYQIWETEHGVPRGTPHRVSETPKAPYVASTGFPANGTAADGALWAAEKFTEALALVNRQARVAKLAAVPVHEAHEEPTKATVRPGRVPVKKSGGRS